MGLSKRILKYVEQNYTGVVHTTLDPEGPGVVRIHMIPPMMKDGELGASVVILNGQDILPINTSWSILLCEFIRQVNQYAGREITAEDNEHILQETVKGVRKVFPLLPKRVIRRDIRRIMETFASVARGEIPQEDVAYMSLGEYAPYMRAPHRMDLLVSAMTKNGEWHCNQKCIHCYAAGQPMGTEEELTTEQWKQIIDRCRAAGIPQVTFTGGEPTLREDLAELIDYAQWFVTRLNTNGIMLTKEFCTKLAKASLDSVQITFYSENEQIHNQLVGAQQFRNTLAGIENALEAGLNVSVNTPLCLLNREYVRTLEFLHERGVRYVTCSGMITTGNARKAESEYLQLNTEELQDILREACEYCFAHGMEISFTSPGWIEDEFFDELGITRPTCGACLSNMAVTPGGQAVPCQSDLSGEPLGNMLTDSWEDIWNHEICVKRRAYSAMTLGECPLRVRKEPDV